MDDEFQEMLSYMLEKEVVLSGKKPASIAASFSSTEDFLDADEAAFRGLRYLDSNRRMNLPEDKVEKLQAFIKSGWLDPERTSTQNHQASVIRVFMAKQRDMIKNLTLDHLNINPFLIPTLGLTDPESVIRVNVYMFVTRSIVTSMGYLLEDLLVSCSKTVTKLRAGWDLVKVDEAGKEHFFEVKSGTNDLDMGQVETYATKIDNKRDQGDMAYFGIAYGKDTDETVSIGFLKKILGEGWKEKTMIGRELWAFLSGDDEYVDELADAIAVAARQVVGRRPIYDEIEDAIERLTEELLVKYQGEGNVVAALYRDLF